MTRAQPEDRAVSLRYALTAILRERVGYHERYASQIAEDILHGLQERYGGDELYIPKTANRIARDAAVRQMFNGRNRVEVCRTFRISRATFYRIVAIRE